MTAETVQDILDRAIFSVHNGVSQALPAMEAARGRTDFFSLPRELRDWIYELAATPQAAEFRWFRKNFGRSAGLLHVAKQVREEFLPFFYGRKLLVYRGTDFWDEFDEKTKLLDIDLGRWLKAIGKTQAALIKHIELRFYCAKLQDVVDMVHELDHLHLDYDDYPGPSSKKKVTTEEVIKGLKLDGLGVPLQNFIVRYEYQDDKYRKL